MSRALQIRRGAASALVAVYAATLLTCLLVGFFVKPPEPTQTDNWSGHTWVLQLEFGLGFTLALIASLGLARSWWWARMLSASLALAEMFWPVVSLVSGLHHPRELSDLVRIAWASALLACLRGPAFCALFEGRQQVGASWRAPGMRALWWAIVLNGVTLVRLAGPLLDPWREAGGFGIPSSLVNQHAPAYWPSVALAALLFVGLGLLARQQTTGLLLAAVVSVVLPVALLACRRCSVDARFVTVVLLPSVPGLLAAWVALGFRARAMWKILRS
jgi:hypothetical protein